MIRYFGHVHPEHSYPGQNWDFFVNPEMKVFFEAYGVVKDGPVIELGYKPVIIAWDDLHAAHKVYRKDRPGKATQIIMAAMIKGE